MDGDQPLPLLSKIDSSMAMDPKQCSEQLENLGIASHAAEDNSTTTTSQSNSLSSTDEKQQFSSVPFDAGPDTKQLYNEMVRTNQ